MSYCAGYFLESETALKEINKQSKKLSSELERLRAEEQEVQDKINEDAKDLEKVSTKMSAMQKKVNLIPTCI